MTSLDDELFFEDPDLEAAAREFREAIEREQQELEEIEEEIRDRQLDMQFAFLEFMWRGDLVRVDIGNKRFSGVITHVGENNATISSDVNNRVDVMFGRVTSVLMIEPRHSDGRALRATDPRRFVARLREVADTPMFEVEVGDGQGGIWLGQIYRIHKDHIVMKTTDMKEWIVPLANVSYCLQYATARRSTR